MECSTVPCKIQWSLSIETKAKCQGWWSLDKSLVQVVILVQLYGEGLSVSDL